MPAAWCRHGQVRYGLCKAKNRKSRLPSRFSVHLSTGSRRTENLLPCVLTAVSVRQTGVRQTGLRQTGACHPWHVPRLTHPTPDTRRTGHAPCRASAVLSRTVLQTCPIAVTLCSTTRTLTVVGRVYSDVRRQSFMAHPETAERLRVPGRSPAAPALLQSVAVGCISPAVPSG